MNIKYMKLTTPNLLQKGSERIGVPGFSAGRGIR